MRQQDSTPSILCTTVLLAALWIGQSSPTSAQERRQAYIAVDGYSLHLTVTGEEQRTDDSVTIVLDAGRSAESTQWANLQPLLSRELNSVVASYDRFGFGVSDLPESSYDIRQEAIALHTALTALQLPDRVLLVGHSFAGLTIHHYATLWPDEVNGLIFLDSNTARAMLALKDLLFSQPANLDPETKREKALARVNSALMDTLTLTYQDPLPTQLPVIVISAETGFFRPNAFRLTHELLATSVDSGQRLVAEASGHNIAGDRPELVIASIRTLLGQAQE